MLKFNFVLNSPSDVVDSYSRGYLSVSCNETEYGSADFFNPILILDCICDIMSGILIFINSEFQKEYIYQSAYGDYGIKIIRKKQNYFIYACGKQNNLICQTTLQELRLSLWNGANKFFNDNLIYIYDDKEGDSDTNMDMYIYMNSILEKWIHIFPDIKPINLSTRHKLEG